MKKNKLPNIYGADAIPPPALEGREDEMIPPPSKVPSIKERNFDDPIFDELAEVSKKHMEKLRPELQRKMRLQEIENLKRMLEDHENEMQSEKVTVAPPDTTRDAQPPTSIPQPFDTEIGDTFDPEANKQTSLNLSANSRLYAYFQKYANPPHTKSPIRPPRGEEEDDIDIPSLSKLPEFTVPTEDEMKDWEDFISLKRRKKERQEGYLGEESKLDPEARTIPPPKKKASQDADSLLKMCSKYHDLCRKL